MRTGTGYFTSVEGAIALRFRRTGVPQASHDRTGSVSGAFHERAGTVVGPYRERRG